jgi:repressor LexA
MKLTERQQEVLDLIRRYTDETGYPPTRADYFLRVKGDSMIEAGIFEGDLLAVHRTTEAHNGQIVVARIDDEVTVKRLQRTRSKHQVLLLPENARYQPIEVDLREREFSIEGLSVGVLRRSV